MGDFDDKMYKLSFTWITRETGKVTRSYLWSLVHLSIVDGRRVWPNLYCNVNLKWARDCPPESNCEAIRGGGIEELVVFVPVAVLEQHQVVVVHHLLAEHHGQELVVGEVLHEGGNDMSRLLRVWTLISCGHGLTLTEKRIMIIHQRATWTILMRKLQTGCRSNSTGQ